MPSVFGTCCAGRMWAFGMCFLFSRSRWADRPPALPSRPLMQRTKEPSQKMFSKRHPSGGRLFEVRRRPQFRGREVIFEDISVKESSMSQVRSSAPTAGLFGLLCRAGCRQEGTGCRHHQEWWGLNDQIKGVANRYRARYARWCRICTAVRPASMRKRPSI